MSDSVKQAIKVSPLELWHFSLPSTQPTSFTARLAYQLGCIILFYLLQEANNHLPQLQRDAALPNPDPAADSPSAALVNDYAPYMVATYARPPPVFVQGEGSWLWDIENRKYLDFTAGIAVTGLGHSDPELTDIIAQQVCSVIRQ